MAVTSKADSALGSTFTGRPDAPSPDLDCAEILRALDLEGTAFRSNDITAGTENELQAAVAGRPEDIDLPLSIRSSNFLRNVVRRAAAGEGCKAVMASLDEYLDAQPGRVWENSWVRFPVSVLTPEAYRLLFRDLSSNKRDPESSPRTDAARFFICQQGEEYVRPISYLLRLSLAQALSDGEPWHPTIREAGERATEHFLNDNSSPETCSLYVVSRPERTIGEAVGQEMAQRFLLTQLLVMYANARFGLSDNGQQALVYFCPHPPTRQKQLNTLISDAFYRELFMNPCLSGWDEGERKAAYMHLCHQVLSRSQLNAVIKLKDAGIITRNLVVLPSTSNVSLANNGTHLSLGSRGLTECRRDRPGLFGEAEEKYIGDLVIKIVEHFLPLFVGTYTAAPYRLDYWDFHPERALGFLPHELDAMHLRMLWRRWKKKAGLSVFGQPVTPLGPVWLDKTLSAAFRLRGDVVGDFRLIDYLVSLLSTGASPALDGRLGNETRLKHDLAQLGVFDESMSLYLLYKLRSFAAMGFTGFEGRHYSAFGSFIGDMGEAASLQALITALAFRYVATGTVRHCDIPDDPFIESERRQFLFTSAIGVGTCNVKQDTGNGFLLRLLGHTKKTRASRRYPGYLRVRVADYRSALVDTLETDAADLVEEMGLGDVIGRLRARLEQPAGSTAGRLMAGILDVAGARRPLALSGEEFNRSAEAYYRGTLRRRHLAEGLEVVMSDLRAIEHGDSAVDEEARGMVRSIIGARGGHDFLESMTGRLLREDADPGALRRCIALTVIVVWRAGRPAAAPAVTRERCS